MAVPCIFQTKYKLGENNARLALFGDSPVLGEWTPRKACFADYLEQEDLYEVTAYLPVNTVCHFKWCIIDKNFNIIYCDNKKQRAFKVEGTMMYVKAPWNNEHTVIPVRNGVGRTSHDKVAIVVFQMNFTNITEQFTGHLCLVGNVRTLGSWLVNNARVADCSSKIGQVVACLLIDAKVEFKWIFRDQDGQSSVWEDGPNRVYTVENNTVTVIECEWNQPHTFWICNYTTGSQATKGQKMKQQYYNSESTPVKVKPALKMDASQEQNTEPFSNLISTFTDSPYTRHCILAGIVGVVGYGLYRILDPS